MKFWITVSALFISSGLAEKLCRCEANHIDNESLCELSGIVDSYTCEEQ